MKREYRRRVTKMLTKHISLFLIGNYALSPFKYPTRWEKTEMDERA